MSVEALRFINENVSFEVRVRRYSSMYKNCKDCKSLFEIFKTFMIFL